MNINLTNQTAGSPHQRLYQGEGETRVGSELRILAHEIYHVAFWEPKLAANENAAVNSANRAVLQYATEQLGGPKLAGVRQDYYTGGITKPRSEVDPGTTILY